MLSLFKLELYKLGKNRGFLLLLAALILMTIFMGWIALDRTVDNIYLIPENYMDESGDLDSALSDLEGLGKPVYILDEYHVFNQEGFDMLRPGGALYEKYKDSAFLDELIHMQEIDGSRYAGEDENAFEKWAFTKSMQDGSAIYWSSIFLAAFFFGNDFTKRTYNGPVYFGRGRNSIFLAKLFTYCLIALLLSLLEIFITLKAFIPDYNVLPREYIARCLTLRGVMGFGTLSLPMIFTFIFKDVYKSMAAYFLFMLLFMSNRAIVDINPIQYSNSALWAMDAVSSAILLQFVIALSMIFVSSVISYMLFRRTELK